MEEFKERGEEFQEVSWRSARGLSIQQNNQANVASQGVPKTSHKEPLEVEAVSGRVQSSRVFPVEDMKEWQGEGKNLQLCFDDYPTEEGWLEEVELVKQKRPGPNRSLGRRSFSSRGEVNLAFSQDSSLELETDPEAKEISREEISREEISRVGTQSLQDAVRSRSLTLLRKLLVEVAADSGEVTRRQLQQLLNNRQFSTGLFALFAPLDCSLLPQDDWWEKMRSAPMEAWLGQADYREELVDLLEAVAFQVCRMKAVTVEDFHKIWSSEGVVGKMVQCIDRNQDGVYSLEECMAFLVALTSKAGDTALTRDKIAWLEKVFRSNLAPGQEEFTLKEFKKIVPSKNSVFVEGAFRIFDADGSGTVSLEEFLETMHQFSQQGDQEKLLFLFKVYDTNGDGQIDEGELRDIIGSCVAENGMEFDGSQVSDLTAALFSDAVRKGQDGISVDDLSAQFRRHEGLLENLTLSIGKWLVPPKPAPKKTWQQELSQKIPQNLNMRYFSNNMPFFVCLIAILLVNLGLFVYKIFYFHQFPMLDGITPNFFYMVSRACGATLKLNSVLILVLVLRYTITMLRKFGLASILPLDNNIYFHKLVGRLIFGQAWLHSLTHLVNFGVNVQPDPVRLLQLSESYWQANLTQLGYLRPTGCFLVPLASNLSIHCSSLNLKSSLDLQGTSDLQGSLWSLSSGLVSLCQACPPPFQPWTYSQWLLTTEPGLFGTVPGWANPTGVALLIILTTMVICSMNFVRRSGAFRVFYLAHLNYVFFYILLLLHAPDFWKWFVVFGCIWSVEMLYRMVTAFLGRGRTVVEEGFPLASKVTHLKIRKPANFIHRSGDWVFLKVPAIAGWEWHPFTISSAPEVEDTFSVHVRGVGQWTNKLYAHYEQKAARLEASPSLTFSQTKKDSELARLERPLEIYVDGPFGSPSSNIYRAEHAVLVGTGIGITPFASILQSISRRYSQAKLTCPNCQHSWSEKLSSVMGSLRKVDFFWINRDQKSFEWFVSLLSQLEVEQADTGTFSRFLEMHMYVTSALQKTDMKTVFLQMAMDLLHEKSKRDLVTGLKARTNAGRPNWDKVFTKIRQQKVGKITVFFCGNPSLAKMLKKKCDEFGFTFRKEVF